jgi:hypothetical protein
MSATTRSTACVEIGGDLVDEADPQRRRRIDPLAGEEVPAARGSGRSSRAPSGDHSGDDPEPDLREAEHRVLAGDGDVDAGGQPRATAEGVPLDPRDDRRGAAPDRVEHPVEPAVVLDVLLVRELDRGALPLDVRARAERRPVARKHHDPRVADVGERFRERRDQLGVERDSGAPGGRA